VFTGIVEELGSLRSVDHLPGDAAAIWVTGPLAVSDALLGSSICTSGVCLTVAELDGDSFRADVMRETLLHSTLGQMPAGEPLNLERAVRADTRLGGHVVSGHVDTMSRVISRVRAEHWEVLRCDLPVAQMRQVALKGSITIDGVSLTVSGVGETEDGGHWFEVSLIPTTLDETTLGSRQVGAYVNLETDVLAKYVQRLVENGSAT
jgi:riboflavin synthase